MAQIKVVGDAVVVESAATLETLKKVEKYRPKKLYLYAEDGKTPTFRVATTKGVGCINANGASFGGASRDGSGRATITLGIPSDVTNVTDYIEDVIGASIIRLNEVEAGLDSVIAEIEAEREAVRSAITLA